MYVQGVDNVYELDFNGQGVTYGEVFLQAEREFSAFNFEAADTERLFRHFADAEAECQSLLARDSAAGPAGLRPVPEGEPSVQSAGCARRDQRHRAGGLYRPGARAGAGLLRGLAARRAATCAPRRRRRHGRAAARAAVGGDPGADAGARGRQISASWSAPRSTRPSWPIGSLATYSTPRRLALVRAAAWPRASPTSRSSGAGRGSARRAQALEGFLALARRRRLPARGAATIARAASTSPASPARRPAHAATCSGRCWASVLRPLSLAQVDALGRPHGMRWVRPLHGIVCLLDGEVVPLDVRAADGGRCDPRASLPGARRRSRCADFEDYRQKLDGGVRQLDAPSASGEIAAEADRLARAAQLRVRHDPGLLGELAGLVEWPVCCSAGSSSASWTCRRRCWSPRCASTRNIWRSRTREGRLAPRFVIVANLSRRRTAARRSSPATSACCAPGSGTPSSSGSRTARRRSPAACRRSTASCSTPGSARSATRCAGSRRWRPGSRTRVPGADADAGAARGAPLCKADLVTGMVGEFPELQGIMGRYYAQDDRRAPDSVADGDRRALRAAGPERSLPDARRSAWSSALADKLDTLVGFFAIGEKPTGSKDPFALRRAALGVIRLILENRLRLPLRAAFEQALAGYGDQAARSSTPSRRGERAARLLRRPPEGASARTPRACATI